MGSYDSYVLYDNYKWSDYELDSFTLGDWQTDGLILRYVIDKEKRGRDGEASFNTDARYRRSGLPWDVYRAAVYRTGCQWCHCWSSEEEVIPCDKYNLSCSILKNVEQS